MRRRLCLAVLLTAFAAGCGPGDGGQPAPTEPDQSQTGPVPEEVRVSVYLVRDERVGAAGRAVEAPAVLRGALEQLLAGPTSDETGWGLSTAIPEGVELLDVGVAEGTATVDLSGSFDDGGGSAAMFLRLAQVVHTATQFATVERIALRIDGEPVTVFSAEGIELSATLSRADVEQQAPTILVEAPLPGAEVSGSFSVVGTANTFEATLQWQLVDGAGAELGSGFTTATCGTGCRGTFAFEVMPGALGPATLRVFALSAEDGSETSVVEISLALG